MRILITGGTGFIGSNILNDRNFCQNNKFLILYKRKKPILKNKNFKFLKVDIGELSSKNKIIRKFDPQVIINLAWEGIPNFSKKMCKINYNKQKKFIDYVINNLNIKKILVSGTCFEYGTVNKICKENKIFYQQNNFSISKISLFNYFKNKVSKKNIDLIWLRIFYVYGPYQRNGSLIPHLISNLKINKNVILKNPYEKKDFIYISDVVDSIKLFLKINANGVFNLGSGKSYSALSLSKKLKKIMNSNSKILFDKKIKNKNYKFFADLTKTKKTINWKPKINIIQGLNKTFKISKKNVSIF